MNTNGPEIRTVERMGLLDSHDIEIWYYRHRPCKGWKRVLSWLAHWYSPVFIHVAVRVGQTVIWHNRKRGTQLHWVTCVPKPDFVHIVKHHEFVNKRELLEYIIKKRKPYSYRKWNCAHVAMSCLDRYGSPIQFLYPLRIHRMLKRQSNEFRHLQAASRCDSRVNEDALERFRNEFRHLQASIGSDSTSNEDADNRTDSGAEGSD